MNLEFTLRVNGDRAIDIVFAAEPTRSLAAKIHALSHQLRSQKPLPVEAVVPAFQCVTLILEAGHYANRQWMRKLKRWLLQNNEWAHTRMPLARVHRIPVCYDEDFAPDLPAVCEHTGLSVTEVIDLHCQTEYYIYMLGFSPGFVYLHGLSKALHCPRKAEPVLKVTPGSVAIGGMQTGIYACATPGGWQVIGRTPFVLFRLDKTPPNLVQPLDSIRFYAIDRDTFNRLSKESPQ